MKMQRLLGLVLFAGMAVLVQPTVSADRFPDGDHIGLFTSYDPATKLVSLGETRLPVSPEAAGYLQTNGLGLVRKPGVVYRASFNVTNGVVETITIWRSIE